MKNFIIEDGDICLAPRESDNMSEITSILNLGEGILGTVLDIGIIITTNAKISEMDGAIERKGRLCKNISVDALPYEQATKVFQRIIKENYNSISDANDKMLSKVLPLQNEYILADIYAEANQTEINNAVVKNKIGFGT